MCTECTDYIFLERFVILLFVRLISYPLFELVCEVVSTIYSSCIRVLFLGVIINNLYV